MRVRVAASMVMVKGKVERRFDTNLHDSVLMSVSSQSLNVPPILTLILTPTRTLTPTLFGYLPIIA